LDELPTPGLRVAGDGFEVAGTLVETQTLGLSQCALQLGFELGAFCIRAAL
jgi:hypothetical protein